MGQFLMYIGYLALEKIARFSGEHGSTLPRPMGSTLPRPMFPQGVNEHIVEIS